MVSSTRRGLAPSAAAAWGMSGTMVQRSPGFGFPGRPQNTEQGGIFAICEAMAAWRFIWVAKGCVASISRSIFAFCK